MELINVFIDSNIIIRENFSFQNGSLHNLSRFVKSNLVVLYTNSIVVKEVHKNIEQNVKQAVAQIRNKIKKNYCLNEVSFEEEYKSFFEDIRKFKWESIVKNAWEKYLEKNEVIVLENNRVNLLEVIEDYFSAKPPFENKLNKKTEFPDAIIIKSLMEYMDSYEIDNMIVLSADKGWKTAFLNFNVEVVDNLKYFLNELAGKYNQEAHALISEYIKSVSVQGRLKNEIENFTDECEIFYSVYDKDEICESFDIEVLNVKITPINSSIQSFEFLNDSAASVSVLFNIEMYIKYLETDYSNSYYDAEEEEYIILDEKQYTQIHNINIEGIIEVEFDETLTNINVKGVNLEDQIMISNKTRVFKNEEEKLLAYEESMQEKMEI